MSLSSEVNDKQRRRRCPDKMLWAITYVVGAGHVASFQVSHALVIGVFLGMGKNICRKEGWNWQNEPTEMLKQKYVLMACSSDLNTILPNTKTLGTHLESKFILGSSAASISCLLLLKLLILPELSSSVLLLITQPSKAAGEVQIDVFFPLK